MALPDCGSGPASPIRLPQIRHKTEFCKMIAFYSMRFTQGSRVVSALEKHPDPEQIPSC
jgi:hypothetical protein